jgi:hypothetical protein
MLWDERDVMLRRPLRLLYLASQSGSAACRGSVQGQAELGHVPASAGSTLAQRHGVGSLRRGQTHHVPQAGLSS